MTKGPFPFVCPVRYANPVTEHVSSHSKSLSKDMARALGGANNLNPKSLGVGGGGATIENDPKKTEKFLPFFY